MASGAKNEFRLFQGRLLWLNYLKTVQVTSFAALCNLIAKMHYTSKFW